METDEIYKFIGYAVAVIFFIYLISKAFSLNVRVIEGMVGNKKDGKKDSDGGISANRDSVTNGDDMDKKIIEKEKGNDKQKEVLIKNKEQYKDALSVAYNRELYLLISKTVEIELLDVKQDVDNLYKQLKSKKDYLDVLDFAYNEVDKLA